MFLSFPNELVSIWYLFLNYLIKLESAFGKLMRGMALYKYARLID